MFKYLIFGDRAIIIQLGNEISPQINKKVRSLYMAITQANIAGVVSVNPTYTSITVEYKPNVIRYKEICEEFDKLSENLDNMWLPAPSIITVPVLYGGEKGPDIETVMSMNNLTEDQVISVHTSVDYLVYMLGFTPGFAFLGGLDKRLHTPRLQTPRVHIKGGSVGIANSQTGIYSVDSPGGWQLIGHTPVKMYDPNRSTPIIHKSGDYIRFKSIEKTEYDDIKEKVDSGVFDYATLITDNTKIAQKSEVI